MTLNSLQPVMLTVLLGPEDTTAWARLKASGNNRVWHVKNRERVADRKHVWYRKNSEKVKGDVRRWQKDNPERVAESNRAWKRRNPYSPEKNTANWRTWKAKNPEKAAESQRRTRNSEPYRERRRKNVREREKSDPFFCLLRRIRTRMYLALKTNAKSSSSRALIGCKIFELRAHLESLFVPGMDWSNYGPVWHVDHKRPCASFDLSDPAQQRECFHFTNLQPLFAGDNLRKGATWQ